jgi:hypothetical protein
MTRSTSIRVDALDSTEAADIHGRILEGGKQLAVLVIGKEFPIAGDIWPHINRIHWLIDNNKLNDMWVIMLILDEREVSDFVFAYFLSFLPLLNLYLLDCVTSSH